MEEHMSARNHQPMLHVPAREIPIPATHVGFMSGPESRDRTREVRRFVDTYWRRAENQRLFGGAEINIAATRSQ
jgi:hypothetical protein